MKVLMFGWEFPPLNQGGLGTACYGLTKGLSRQGVQISFVLPSLSQDIKSDFVRIISAEDRNVRITRIQSPLQAYMTSKEYSEQARQRRFRPNDKLYGKNLFEEVCRYAQKAAGIAAEEEHDIIHCHDWMTFQAGIEAKKVSGKPLVVHVHATEFDRTGGSGVNQYVFDIERQGMEFADTVITVSNYTKQKIINNYGIPAEKIQVMHNGVDTDDIPEIPPEEGCSLKDYDRVVLFLGRITLQKGPDYFIEAAKKVLEYEPNVKFILAGTGDMEYQMIEKAAAMGMADKVLFSGFLKGGDVDRAYRMADLYVMPSVSEPFGIAPLEAMKNGTPVIISKQSGVSEVIMHCLKTDFWDVNEMANKIIAVLRYNELKSMLGKNGHSEVKNISWDIPARKCVGVYNGLVGGGPW